MSKFIAWSEAHRGLWLDCVRIFLGLGLFARGVMLITHTSTGYYVNLLQQADAIWLLKSGVLHYVMLAHFLGGVLLTIGFFTRLAALVQIPILAGAVLLVHRQDGLFDANQALAFSTLVLFLLVVIAAAGAGKFSLDYATFGPARADDDPEHPSIALPQV